nr:hypothetical protein MOLUWOTD_MOLUWOTD_CDS_0014 [Microvirus sp.]
MYYFKSLPQFCHISTTVLPLSRSKSNRIIIP